MTEKTLTEKTLTEKTLFYLLVKGDETAAIAVARARNAEILDHSLSAFGGETLIRARAPYLAIAEWFSEPGSAPFPPGTLLYYREL